MRGFSAFQIGETVVVTGLAQMATSPFTAQIARRLDLRVMLAIGMALFSVAIYFTAGLTNQAGFWELLFPQALRGFALMFCYLPANMISLGSLPPDRLKSGASLYNLTRDLGGAIVLATIGTIMSNRLHFHWNRLIEDVNPARPAVQHFLDAATARLDPHFTGDNTARARKAARRHRSARGPGADLQRRDPAVGSAVRHRPATAAAGAPPALADGELTEAWMAAAFPALVAILALIVYVGTFVNAGRMRGRFNVKAPVGHRPARIRAGVSHSAEHPGADRPVPAGAMAVRAAGIAGMGR